MIVPLLLLGGTFAAMILASKTSSASPAPGGSPDPCGGPPPSPQPPIPGGFSIFRGLADPIAQAKAREALRSPLGHVEEFSDASGRRLAVIVSWHCHSPSSGQSPIGWHKGANLLERRSA